MYYEGYLAAQQSEQSEDSVEEQFKDLIQSQESDLDEDDVKVEQVNTDTSIPVSDDIDELHDEPIIS